MPYRWKLLKPPYKYTRTIILLAAHKETAIAIATIMEKKIFCSIVGGWYEELKVKEFCVFDHIKMTCFQTIPRSTFIELRRVIFSCINVLK